MDLGMTGAGETPRQEDDEPLPARTGRLPKPDPVILDRAVRSRIWHALGAAALWVLVVAATIVGSSVLFDRADRLLTDGVKVPARVVAVEDGKTGAYLVVDYLAPGVEGRIDLDSGNRYFVGEVLTVYYDPADPAHVRTTEEPNGDDSWALGSVVVVVLEAGALSWAVAYPVVLDRRRRIARRSGWRPVKVTSLRNGTYVLNHAGRERTSARVVTLLRGRYEYLAKQPVSAWVAGEGARLLLVAPRGNRLYAIPLGRSPGWSPILPPRRGRSR
ncbi:MULTISPECIES: DUF3592 domain-containing protein [unclassified Amycolatopsis]|uniref:DUF3592 domain-containing protein n=1 Tax=unclassified Amycolatopsis TaxID=2618356 RepID=UPI001C69955D|nr:DUF3592 domain-containing protein [Amycolatopsis sp. DSM 110486]QYN16971.1 DUF3592 domain-containing protein [Amycolatopsis sp. DSM 110486]